MPVIPYAIHERAGIPEGEGNATNQGLRLRAWTISLTLLSSAAMGVNLARGIWSSCSSRIP